MSKKQQNQPGIHQICTLRLVAPPSYSAGGRVRSTLLKERNTEPMNEWILAFCIIFRALFDVGRIQGWFLDGSGHFKKCKKLSKKCTRNQKEESTDENSKPMKEWRLGCCIIFCALFDGGRFQGWFLADSWQFEKMSKIVKKMHPKT